MRLMKLSLEFYSIKLTKFPLDDLVELFYNSKIISEKNVSNLAKEKGRDSIEILDNIKLSINKKIR